MKKTVVVLLAILLVSMLGGCYKSDVVMDIGMNGDVEVTSTFYAPAQEYVKNGMVDKKTVKETLGIDSMNETMKKESEKISVECVDENGNLLAEDIDWSTEEKTIGMQLKAKYDNIESVNESPIFIDESLYNGIGLAMLGVEAEYNTDIEIIEKRTLFGTKYIASGKYKPYGKKLFETVLDLNIQYAESELENLPATTEEEENIQNNEQRDQLEKYINEAKEQKDKLQDISSTITFNFPLAFSKTNADSKNLFGNKLTWTATNDVSEKEIYFEVFVINPIILAAGFIILILLIIILILALKKKKKPDAFFVDAEGNEIPVYDVEETDGDFEEETEEVVDENEDAEEIASFEDVIDEKDAADDEKSQQ